MFPELFKLPIDISDFKNLRQHNFLYIDKTKLAYEMITGGRCYFLSRPRRFGKSLLVSTLAEILSGNRILFQNLWIDQSSYNWPIHGVIKLDFSTIGAIDTETFKHNLCEALAKIIDQYQLKITIEFSNSEIALSRIIRALHAKFGRVAILIDEYDDPITQLLAEPILAYKIRDAMQRFFKMIKGSEEHVNFVFITGVSAFSKAGLFSGLNNLQNITLQDQFATICGYTESEIQQYFNNYLQVWADNKQITVDNLQSQIKNLYNGYRFSLNAPSVYNPFSLAYALKTQSLDNFWIESGNPKFLITELSKTSRQSELQLLNLNNIEASKYTLGMFDIDQIPLPALMFQTGYLTIDNLDPETGLYKLKCPNQEVKSTLEKYLLAIFINSDLNSTELLVHKFKAALNKQDLATAITFIQLIFAKIPYQIHLKAESFYHGLLLTICNAAEIKTQGEYATSHGSIDLILDLPTIFYIIEIKFNQSAEIALSQINNKHYYEPFMDQHKAIVLLGINFEKTAGEFKISYAHQQLK